MSTFASLGLSDHLVNACQDLGFKEPTPIQKECIPYALEGKDIIGLAQTGSGKTAAFALPVLNALWDNPAPFFGLVLAPTRELAFQITETFEALGARIGVKVATLVGGVDMVGQAMALGKRPHVIVATPGRLNDHLESTKGFSLKNLKYLVMDEADRLLDLEFGAVLDNILKALPRESRHTFLFSATMTSKVGKLQRASLRNPVKLEISTKYETVSTLHQYYHLVPFKYKDLHLVYMINSFAGQTAIIFVRTVLDAQRLAIMLRVLAFSAISLHGSLSQSSRMAALNRFKAGERSILVATDVAARGLDIPSVDVVINYDIPTNSKDYIHRVGRTARAGRAGKSISFVSQYDVELYQKIEAVLGKKLDAYPMSAEAKNGVFVFAERVADAQREASKEIRDKGVGDSKSKRRRVDFDDDDKDRDDDEVQAGVPKLSKKNKKGK